MSKLEYICESCGEGFVRVVLQGESPPAVVCPKCRGRQCKASANGQGLFEGISNFSSLARDTN